MIPDAVSFTAQRTDEIDATVNRDVNAAVSSVTVRLGDVSVNLLPGQAHALRHRLARVLDAALREDVGPGWDGPPFDAHAVVRRAWADDDGTQGRAL